MAAFTPDEARPNEPARTRTPPSPSCTGWRRPRSATCWPRSSNSAPTKATARSSTSTAPGSRCRAAGGRQAHAAWFNLGAEWGHAGEPRQRHPRLSHRARAAARISPPPRSTSACCWNGAANRRWRSPAGPRRCSRTTRASRCINQRARLLEQLGQLDEAEAAMRASLAIRHDQPDVIQHWLHIRQRMCAWPILNDAIRGLTPDDLMDELRPARRAGADRSGGGAGAHRRRLDRAQDPARAGASRARRRLPPRPYPRRLHVVGFLPPRHELSDRGTVRTA